MEKHTSHKAIINNDFYDALNEQWYQGNDHPIALLRAENKVRVPWVQREIETRLGNRKTVLDIGCGAGLLTNPLSSAGHQVTGIDLSEGSLNIAKKHDITKKVKYLPANAYELPFENDCFDVVCAMDILEHVEHPEKLISEASRVLKPNGLFFFHTFNRNPLSYLIIIKGVEWFVKNTPPNMHVYDLFIKPQELKTMCTSKGLSVDLIQGFMPNILSSAFWKMLYSRKVPDNYSFVFNKCLWTGYCGIAIKL